MLGDGELVGAWAEGFKGIGRPYSDRDKLQWFGRGGFVAAAIRTECRRPAARSSAPRNLPAGRQHPVAGAAARPAVHPDHAVLPLLGPLGLVPLPSKWLLEFGEPIRTDDYDEGAADDPMLVFNVTDQVRETIQQTLYGC